jgi:hypothetical protein
MRATPCAARSSAICSARGSTSEYLLRYAKEASWREDNRCSSNGEQVNRVAGLAVKARKSVDFTGCW